MTTPTELIEQKETLLIAAHKSNLALIALHTEQQTDLKKQIEVLQAESDYWRARCTALAQRGVRV